jgi:heme A synthase
MQNRYTATIRKHTRLTENSTLIEKKSPQSHTATRRRFTRFAWGVLVYNVLVVLWGAVVRASVSGDGCGSHWPLCNGEVIPSEAVTKTLIEYSHRVTSGVALLVVILLFWSARRVFERSHPARRAAAVALFFTITEAAIGAGLVIFGLVAEDDSIARALLLSTHLVNTFILLAALALTAWWAGAIEETDHARLRTKLSAADVGQWVFAFALGGMLLLGVSGAIAALGDTLFPAASLEQAWSEDANGAAHLLVRLRVLHPLIAVIVAANLLWAAWIALRSARDARFTAADGAARMRFLAWAVVALVFAQMLAGAVNVLLLAPVWMQVVHLLLADALWVALVLMTAARFAMVSVAAPGITYALAQLEASRAASAAKV